MRLFSDRFLFSINSEWHLHLHPTPPPRRPAKGACSREGNGEWEQLEDEAGADGQTLLVSDQVQGVVLAERVVVERQLERDVVRVDQRVLPHQFYLHLGVVEVASHLS